MKKEITLSVLSILFVSNAFAICDTQRAERDEFRNLCISVGGISTGVAYGGGILLHGWGGLLGLIPGIVAHNQCRIWMEKESNLKNCEDHHHAMQQAELLRQEQVLAAAIARAGRISSINSTYNTSEEAARERHRVAVRELMSRYMQAGRNMRDATVQTELRSEVRTLENTLNLELQTLTADRQRELESA